MQMNVKTSNWYEMFSPSAANLGWWVNLFLHNPKSAISVMMITAYIFEQMSLRFEGAMGFHCYR